MISGFTISPQQRRVWDVQQHGTPLYVKARFCVNGKLDSEHLHGCLTQLLADHTSLRTTYHRKEGVLYPLQVVEETGTYVYSLLDLTDLSAEAQAARMAEEWNAEPVQSGHATDWIPVKLVCIRLNAWQYECLLWVTALAADSFSLQQMVTSLIDRYLHPNPDTNRKPLISYVQFSEWQNKLLDTPDPQADAFWQTCPLATAPFSRVAFQQPAAADRSYQPLSLSWQMPTDWLAQAETLAQTQQTDVATLCLATLGLLLHKHTALETVVAGLVSPGRKYEQLHATIGLLAKMLPVPIATSSTSTFAELLAQTHHAATQATGWAEYFSLKYLTGSPTEKQLTAIPIGLEWIDLSQPLPASDTHAFFWKDFQSLTEPFALKITCLKTSAGLSLTATYDPACFQAETIQWIQCQYDTLLKNVVHDPELSLPQLSSLSLEEKQLVLHTFQPAPTPTEPLTIVELFEQQVARTPQATAIIFEDQTISYAQLHAHVQALAQELKHTRHIGKGDRVPLLQERSPEAIATMLAVLKIGAAYVPIDPSYPTKRIEYMLEDIASPGLPLTPSWGGGTLQDSFGINVPQEQSLVPPPQEGVRGRPEVSLGAVCYVIYTSGSTGMPKGVQVTMSNLVNYVTWANQYYFSGEGRKTFALFTSLAFDLTVTSIFTTLLRGDAIHVFADNDMQQVLPQIFDPATGIDVVKLTPSHISLLKVLDLPVTAVSYAIVGGEAFTQTQAATLWHLNPAMRIFNEYGPTETTVGSTVAELLPSDVQITIGKPIANTQVYVLNAQMQPVSIGETGELCIGGAGVTQGYWQLPALTAERFVPHPFRAGETLYRTGDWSRWLPNGELLYLGRRDAQVKIRGYRIELGEIEKALLRQPEVQDAAVTARGEGDSRYLIAYLVSTAKPDVESIRMTLTTELPEFMVPSYLVVVDKLPLTIHGKTDWDKLPALPEGIGQTAYVAPRTELETALQAIWAEVLGKQEIGMDDNFFAIGGQSIKALQIITRISKQLQVPVSLTTLFADPTIAGLAQHISQTEKVAYQVMEPLPEQEWYDVSFAQQRLWIMDAMGTHKSVYNMPTACVFEGALDREIFTQTITTLQHRHESLRTTFITIDNIPKQKIHRPETLKTPVYYTDLRAQANREEHARMLASQEAITPFDLTTGSLWRVRLLQLEDEKYVATFTLHHIIGDAWSIGLLVKEIAAVYNAFHAGKENPLSPLRIQYKDYAVWQNQQLTDTDVFSNYWKAQFTPMPPRINLTTDFPRPRIKTLTGKRLSYGLGSELIQPLQAIGQQQGVSLFTVMLSAFYTLLYRTTRQTDLVIGTSVAGRDHLDLESQIGFFVNPLAIRTQLAGDQSFLSLLAMVHTQTLGAFEHQLYPFDRLVDDLNLERELNRSPLFDVLVIMQNTHVTEIDTELEGINVSMLGVEVDICEFDLTFNLIPDGDQLQMAVHYSTELFEEESILILLEKLYLICETVSRQPVIQLEDIPVELAEERALKEKKVDLEFNF